MFISYRVADTKQSAARLFEDLQRELEVGEVFLDRQSIDGGQPWPDSIRNGIERAQAVLVLVGSRWLDERDQFKRRRLDLPDDWVRQEVAVALRRQRDALVLPVLIDNAPPIPREALSNIPDIVDFADLQGRPLRLERLEDWHHDLTELLRLLETVGFRRRAPGISGRVATPSSRPIVPVEYLAWLQPRCASVELLGLRLKQGQAVRLNNVYVPLTTPGTATADATGRPGRPRVVEREIASLLLDRLGEGSLYVSGDPGTGKSTFCRWLTWLACEGAVPPAEVEAPDEYQERFPSALVNRLPLLVYLREFWDRLPDPPAPAALSGEEFETLLAGWFAARDIPGLSAEIIAAHFEAGTALLVLDGLDEVPPARRTRLLGGLAEARDGWMKKGNRLLVTSRPYGLTDGEIRRLGLPHAPIQPLPDALRTLLVQRWFRILGDHAEDAKATAGEMLRQVGEQGWLSPLTANPLLLTAMCIVFGEGKRLPEDKYELYDRVVDTVLHNRIPERPRLQLVRARLAVVAHGMHTGEGLGGAERATPQPEVTDKDIDRMLRTYQERSAWTEPQVRSAFEDRDELVSQTGLLLPRGEHHAAFLHLSFQEFLAAQRLADVEGARIRDLFLARGGTPEWRNTLSFIYGSLLATSTTPERAVGLLTDLIERMEPGAVGLQIVAADALEILVRRGIRVAKGVEERFHRHCVETMRGSAQARDRCAVGTAVGKLGDPRFRADVWSLPDDVLLGFVEIPAGPFTMGSDKADSDAFGDETPQHSVTLPTYYVAQWPVTVAQFRTFVEDAGNGGFTPQDDACLTGVANHPVVHVSWHEARAYCRWLTEQLRASDQAPEPLATRLRTGGDGRGPWQVTLPSEAEWEKAARGTDGRIYPWGKEPDPNRANYEETGIGGTSAVGCFPGGANQAYGVEELSGNVDEWTRSLWGKDWQKPEFGYPYTPDDHGRGRENVKAPGDVRRGGARRVVPHQSRGRPRRLPLRELPRRPVRLHRVSSGGVPILL